MVNSGNNVYIARSANELARTYIELSNYPKAALYSLKAFQTAKIDTGLEEEFAVAPTRCLLTGRPCKRVLIQHNSNIA